MTGLTTVTPSPASNH